MVFIPRHGKYPAHWTKITEIIEFDEFNRPTVRPITGVWILRKTGLKRQLEQISRAQIAQRFKKWQLGVLGFLFGIWVTLMLQFLTR